MTEQTRTCLAEDCNYGNPRIVGQGLVVCEWHYREYRDAIADLVDLYALLPTMLDPSSAPDATGIKPKRTDPPAPLRLEVVALMDPRTQTSDTSMHVIGVLGSWAGMIREELNLAQPAVETMTSAQRTLVKHAVWCAGRGWFNDMRTEVLDVVKALRTVTGMHPPKPVGRCHLPGKDDEKCNGHVFEIEGTGGLRCSRCRAQWVTPQEIARFDLIQGSSA